MGANCVNEIRGIIHECIYRYLGNNIIQENYSSRHFSQQMSDITKRFMEFKSMVDRMGGYYRMWQAYPIKISLKPFFKDGLPQKYSKEGEYHIQIRYKDKDDSSKVTGYYVPGFLHKNEYQIVLNVPSNATYDDVYTGLEHEVTHLVDDIIQEYTEYKSYDYPNRKMMELKLPKFARMLLYALWSNAEFNAWQANYQQMYGTAGIDWLDYLMHYLNKANESNDEEEWLAIKRYVVFRTMSEKIARKSPMAFKDYFIKTTFKKLKQMVKKYY